MWYVDWNEKTTAAENYFGWCQCYEGWLVKSSCIDEDCYYLKQLHATSLNQHIIYTYLYFHFKKQASKPQIERARTNGFFYFRSLIE